jgi:spore photoproduct lyase
MDKKNTLKIVTPDKIIINKNLLKDKTKEKRILKIINNIKKFNRSIKIEILNKKEIEDIYIYSNYENTLEKIFVFTENLGQKVKKCPGTRHYLCCNYYTINLYMNCPLGCKYCFLQFYLKNPINTIFINIENIFEQFENKYSKIKIKRIGTGELSDSLVFDPFTEFSFDFIEFFKKFDETFFEFKTKTLFTDNLYKIKPSKNIVVSFSLNTIKIWQENENFTSNPFDRIIEARKLSEYGYSIAFHFDPIFYYENYKNDYLEILNFIKNNIDRKKIVWISLGTFRYHPDMKEILRKNYPDEKITYCESIIGYDNKVRYFIEIRQEIYKFFYDFFNNNFKIPLYLCMESKKLWDKVFNSQPKNIDNLKNIFNIRK